MGSIMDRLMKHAMQIWLLSRSFHFSHLFYSLKSYTQSAWTTASRIHLFIMPYFLSSHLSAVLLGLCCSIVLSSINLSFHEPVYPIQHLRCLLYYCSFYYF
eukprot:NODE_15_length_42055_cov_0.634117.p27 type:complete len:101 gc:universal NODE_15_length_42055_cov_0.634117:23234-22932(-)